jgi:hypothetical protein
VQGKLLGEDYRHVEAAFGEGGIEVGDSFHAGTDGFGARSGDSKEQEAIKTYLIYNTWTKQELKMNFRGLQECIVDMGKVPVRLDTKQDIRI